MPGPLGGRVGGRGGPGFNRIGLWDSSPRGCIQRALPGCRLGRLGPCPGEKLFQASNLAAVVFNAFAARSSRSIEGTPRPLSSSAYVGWHIFNRLATAACVNSNSSLRAFKLAQNRRWIDDFLSAMLVNLPKGKGALVRGGRFDRVMVACPYDLR